MKQEHSAQKENKPNKPVFKCDPVTKPREITHGKLSHDVIILSILATVMIVGLIIIKTIF